MKTTFVKLQMIFEYNKTPYVNKIIKISLTNK